MGKNKLKRFEENHNFHHVIEPQNELLKKNEIPEKGNWNAFFNNKHPITLELGCGKGEYTVELARKNKNRNFIGIDIKGARLWRGAKTSFEANMKNVAFLRIRIDLIDKCFDSKEIDEIWCTFSDPHIGKKKNIKKRLTSSKFLSLYQKIMKDQGVIHLKTDDKILYNYTLEVIELNKLPLLHNIYDIYENDENNIVPQIKTHYEQKWLEEGKKINYISFKLPISVQLKEPEYNHEREKTEKI